MRKAGFLFAIALSGTAMAHAETAVPPASEAATIGKLEEDSCLWLKKHEWANFDTLFADDFRNVSPTGEVRDKKSLSVSGLNVKDCRITTEIAVCMATWRSRSGRCGWKPAIFPEAFVTDTFIRQDGRWQVVSSHQSAIRS